jgi:DNA-binding transcriptional regulator YhcF (GntR family)
LSLNREQFGAVLAALRERLRSGAHVQGEPLPVADLARLWDVSATPVREALSRLAGEGLIEDRRGRGYFAWRTDGADLRDLYQAQDVYARSALMIVAATQGRSRGLRSARLAGAPEDRGAFWEILFAGVALEAGNRFMLCVQQRLADRLAPARRVEPAVLDEASADFEALAHSFNAGAWRDLEEGLKPFFARRRAVADDLVAEMRLFAAKYI